MACWPVTQAILDTRKPCIEKLLKDHSPDKGSKISVIDEQKGPAMFGYPILHMLATEQLFDRSFWSPMEEYTTKTKGNKKYIAMLKQWKEKCQVSSYKPKSNLVVDLEGQALPGEVKGERLAG